VGHVIKGSVSSERISEEAENASELMLPRVSFSSDKSITCSKTKATANAQLYIKTG